MSAEDATRVNSLRNVWAGIRSTLFVAFGGILIGYDTGIISGVQGMRDWLCTFGKPNPSTGQCAITSSQQSLVVSTLSAGAFLGALSVGPVADFLGRRWSIVLTAVIFSVGVAMQVAATALPLFVVGRVFAGCGIGIGSTLIPMYQSECSPKRIRGAIVSVYEFVITTGSLLAAITNNATQDKPSHASWRIPIAIQLVWAFILGVGTIFLPESPRWLIKKERHDDASRALSRLTSLPPDHPEVQAELEEIRLSFQQEKELGESSYLDCFRPGLNKARLRTCTVICLQVLQQFCGIGFIFFYGTVFFKNSGIQKPFLITVATSTILSGMTLPGMWGIEKLGRRKLLIVGATGMCVCQLLIAIVGVTTSTSNTVGQKVLIAFVCLFIAFYASTWGPTCWTVTSEIFPLNIRAKAMSLSMATNWFWNWAVGYSTPYLVNKEPGSAGLEAKVFFIWGSTCAASVLFVYFFVPETKGLSLEQIDLLYQNTTPARSVSYRQQLKHDGVELTFRNAQAKQDSTSDYKEKV